MASNNYIYKMSNAGGMSTVTRYTDMLAGNTTWNPWEPAGAYDALATVTVPSGGAASITFAGIPQGYKHLQVRGMARGTVNSSPGLSLYTNFNGDTSSNYYCHQLRGSGSAAEATYYGPQPSIQQQRVLPDINANASMFGVFIIDILDYASTTKNTTTRLLGGYDTNNTTSGYVHLDSGFWNNTAAVSSVVFTTDGNFPQHSTFALYGIR